MGSAASRIQALDGPWEVHRYLLPGHLRIQFHDTDGTNVIICQCWDEDFADLLTRAWAVPQLMDLLERMVRAYEITDTDREFNRAMYDLAPAARVLLEKLT